jgi:predicted transcriptional regulator
MSTIELSSSQRRILTSLVNLAENEGGVVCGRRIAEDIDRNPGTVRNRMQSLRSLQLVEGVAGPDGGYKPTQNAYETLDLERMDDPEQIPVVCDGMPISGVTVREIELSSVNNPELCRAEIVLRGPVGALERGDRVTIGPTPAAGLRLSGVVDAADVDGDTLMLRVESMETDPEPMDPVAESVSGRSASD